MLCVCAYLLKLLAGTVETPRDIDDECSMEDAMAELGIYDPKEDTSSWTFEEVYADTQWQESNTTLAGEDDTFIGLLPGVTHPGDGRAHSCEVYFHRFWSDKVLY
jgi:hypothetical protein